MTHRVTPEYLLDEWRILRASLDAAERAEHPDITDRFGRVWTWSTGDLYHHDNTLCFPKSWITSTDHPINLPSPRLADNPNYSGLCAICRSEWPLTPEQEEALLAGYRRADDPEESGVDYIDGTRSRELD